MYHYSGTQAREGKLKQTLKCQPSSSKTKHVIHRPSAVSVHTRAACVYALMFTVTNERQES